MSDQVNEWMNTSLTINEWIDTSERTKEWTTECIIHNAMTEQPKNEQRNEWMKFITHNSQRMNEQLNKWPNKN